jgi:hypothetical protein
MVQFRPKFVAFLTLLALVASSKQPKMMDEITPQTITILSEAVPKASVNLAPPLRLLNAWSLKSSYKYFGGLSSLLPDSQGLTALSDNGTIFHFTVSANGRIERARVASLPAGCMPKRIKDLMDSESLARDSVTGYILIGFEGRNAICRTDGALTKALRVVQPPAMRKWRTLSGAEAMVTLRDGRTIILEEGSASGSESVSGLIFEGDPTDPSAKTTAFRYRAPPGSAPTDAVELPGGRILIVNRHYHFPISFSATLTIVRKDMIKPGATVSGQIVARLDSPTLADNFEAVALTQTDGRNFIWLMSDNNFNAYQRTYLVQFELIDGTRSR